MVSQSDHSGLELVTAGMERITSRFGASGWISNRLAPGSRGQRAGDVFKICSEIVPRSQFVAPGDSFSRWKLLLYSNDNVDSGCVQAFLQKDRFDSRCKMFETKASAAGKPVACQSYQANCGEPRQRAFAISDLAGLPEFAAPVRRVAAGFLCQRVKQETAPSGSPGATNWDHGFKILTRLLFRP